MLPAVPDSVEDTKAKQHRLVGQVCHVNGSREDASRFELRLSILRSSVAEEPVSAARAGLPAWSHDAVSKRGNPSLGD